MDVAARVMRKNMGYSGNIFGPDVLRARVLCQSWIVVRMQYGADEH